MDFPAVDLVHFKEILQNRFRSENLIVLSPPSFQAPAGRRVTLSSLTIPTTERDGEASKYKGKVVETQPRGVYFPALLNICPNDIERELGHALHISSTSRDTGSGLATE